MFFKETTTEKAIATERLAPVTLTQKASGVAPKEVHLHAKSRLQKDLRSELLGEDPSSKHLGDTVIYVLHTILKLIMVEKS